MIATIAYDLDPTNRYGHNITIVGVEQPATFSQYSDIFVGLVPKGKLATQFEVMKEGGALKDSSQSAFITKNLPVLYFTQTVSTLRSSFSFTMDLILPGNSVRTSIPIYIDFPGEFAETLFLSITPICSLKNVRYGNNTLNTTILEYATKCEYVNTRKI